MSVLRVKELTSIGNDHIHFAELCLDLLCCRRIISLVGRRDLDGDDHVGALRCELSELVGLLRREGADPCEDDDVGPRGQVSDELEAYTAAASGDCL